MSISINIGNILNSSTETFHEIIDKLQKKNIELIKQELALKNEFDNTLVEAIILTIEELKEEEGFISRLLYSSFGIGKEKNKRREQLIILGSQLKSQLSSTEKSIQKSRHYKETLYSTKKNLTLLHKAFKNKIPFLNNDILQNRAINYMKETSRNIERVTICEDELEIRINHLRSTLNQYRKVLRKIPRYYKLQEENNIQLIESREKKEPSS